MVEEGTAIVRESAKNKRSNGGRASLFRIESNLAWNANRVGSEGIAASRSGFVIRSAMRPLLLTEGLVGGS